MYRGLSYAGIPSEPFSIRCTTEAVEDGVRFTQVVGSRTQSPEILAERLAGPFGVIAREVAELFVSFQPIWTELELTIFLDRFYKGRVVRHSLFPSMSFYCSDEVERFFVPGQMNTPAVRVFPSNGYFRKASDYDGVPNYENWRKRGWGGLVDAMSSGPVGGNPWRVPNPSGLGMGRSDAQDRRPGEPITSPTKTPQF